MIFHCCWKSSFGFVGSRGLWRIVERSVHTNSGVMGTTLFSDGMNQAVEMYLSAL